MKPGQVEHIGDGAYLQFDGHGYWLLANHHRNPTDRVYIDGSSVRTLLRLIGQNYNDGSAKP